MSSYMGNLAIFSLRIAESATLKRHVLRVSSCVNPSLVLMALTSRLSRGRMVSTASSLLSRMIIHGSWRS